MSDGDGYDPYAGDEEDTAEVGALSDDQRDAISMRRVSLLFSDIVAITPFFDKYGDLTGHERIRIHNELLFPVIQANRGRVVKTIGDAIMAVFDTPDDGVAAAIGMQKALDAYNRAHPGEDEAIHVRIGLHTGKAVVDGADMFGDAVNVAARVSSEAEGDQILISAACQQQLTPGAFPTAFHARTWLKGKESVFEIHAVDWQAAQGGDAPLAAALARPRTPSATQPGRRVRPVHLVLIGLCLVIGVAAWWLLSTPNPSGPPLPLGPVPLTGGGKAPAPIPGAPVAAPASASPPVAPKQPVPSEPPAPVAPTRTKPARRQKRPGTPRPTPAAVSPIDPAKLAAESGPGPTGLPAARMREQLEVLARRKGLIRGDLPDLDRNLTTMDVLITNKKYDEALILGRQTKWAVQNFVLTKTFIKSKLVRLLERVDPESSASRSAIGPQLTTTIYTLMSKGRLRSANRELNAAFERVGRVGLD